MHLATDLSLHSITLRRAIRTTLAVFCSVFIYRYFSLTQGFWVTLTVVIVMQATTAATLRKGLQRLIGTLLGIILGSLLVLYIRNPYLLDICLILFLFIAYYLKAFNIINYGIFVVPLTVMVVFLVSALVPEEAPNLILARLYDTLIGGAISIVFTIFVLPNTARHDLKKALQKTLSVQTDFTLTSLKVMFHLEDTHQLYLLQKKLDNALSENRRLYLDWRYEITIHAHARQQLFSLLKCTEKGSQFLFALGHFARHMHLNEINDHLKDKIKNNLATESLTLRSQIKMIKNITTDLAQNSGELPEIKIIVSDLEHYLATIEAMDEHLLDELLA